MVGIGGGVPGKGADIRLGDVVVRKPTGDFGGVVQYDFDKTVAQGVFERTGRLNRPPQILLTAIARLQVDHMMEKSRIPTFLSEMTATNSRTVARTKIGYLLRHRTTTDWTILAIIVK